MRYDAENVSPSRLMRLAERTAKRHSEAIRRDLRPHKTVVHTPQQTLDARKGQFSLRVNVETGRAVFRSDRNDPKRLIPEGDRELFDHTFEAQPLR